MLLIFVIALCLQASYADENYRLNTPIRPSAYVLTITPFFDTGDENAFTFDGEVEITFTTTAATREIKLHSEDLQFSAENVTVARNGSPLALNETNSLYFNTNYTFAYINLQNDLAVGDVYSLRIVYRGPIRTDLNGFYRNYYYENGVKKWLGATQMEPTHARKAFPCFDEPGLKATFTIIVDRPQHYSPSLANTRVQTITNLSNGYIRERFYPTPVMPTYLVAFMVSEFEPALASNDSSRGLSIYTRPEAANQSTYAYEFGVDVVDALSNYFGIDYYSVDSNLKLDHVALPDFRAGAMENWGLVKYREALLLYVPEDSTPYYKYRVAQIVAHETTHMWFGNLVTCHWWSDTWLNEGFANYFQDYITAFVDPDVGSANQLVLGSVYSAYDADSSPSSAPITNNNVNSPAEISGHFGTITYQKAGSVIRMMHQLMGDEAFKHGLTTYLNTNRFSSGYPNYMYAALEEGVTYNNTLAIYPGFNITSVMATWISQAGHPLLEVNVDYETGVATLNQKRYYSNASYSSNEIYAIPITYTTDSSANFNNTRPAFIMNQRTHSFNIEGINAESWVIFNVQETGLYRVNYDDRSWRIITEALRGSGRETIHHLNRAKIVNDLFALFYADEVNFSRLFETLEFIRNEESYTVWYAAIRGLNRLRNSYLGDTTTLRLIDDAALDLMSNIISSLGYHERTTDDFETLRNRMQVLEFACRLGHSECISHTTAMFAEFRDNSASISPSLRLVSYCTGLRHGSAADYEFLWNRMSTTNVANEASVIANALGCTNDENSMRRYLYSMTEEDSPIRTQDLTVPLSSVLSDYSHLPIVLDALESNYTLWQSIYPSMDSILSTVASTLHTDSDFSEFESWLSSCEECSQQSRTAGLAASAQARAAAQWASSHRDQILAVLRNISSMLAPSLMMISASVAVLLSRFNM